MVRSKSDPFQEEGQKYAGRIEVDPAPGGRYTGPPVLTVQHRPYTRDQRDRPQGAEGKDLRPERPQRQTAPPSALKKRLPRP